VTADALTYGWLVAMLALVIWLCHDPKGGARKTKG
jgi:hypothetical protein